MLARSSDARIGWGRWRQAQEYEQAFRQRLGDSIEAGTRDQLDWHAWRADQLQQRLRSANLKDQIKGYTGLAEFSHSVICRTRVLP